MVWLNHAARETTARLLIVFAIMYLVPAADLFHCIIGACEAVYLVFQGEASLLGAGRFFGAVVAGNTVGGVLLVALLNYSQTRARRFPDRDCEAMALTWREWFFGVGRMAGEHNASANNPTSGTEQIEGAETGSLLDQPVPVQDPEPLAEGEP